MALDGDGPSSSFLCSPHSHLILVLVPPSLLSQSSLVPRVFMNFEFRYREPAERRTGREEARGQWEGGREGANNEISRSAFALPEFPFDARARGRCHPSNLRIHDDRKSAIPRHERASERRIYYGGTIRVVVLPVLLLRLSGLLA